MKCFYLSRPRFFRKVNNFYVSSLRVRKVDVNIIYEKGVVRTCVFLFTVTKDVLKYRISKDLFSSTYSSFCMGPLTF